MITLWNARVKYRRNQKFTFSVTFRQSTLYSIYLNDEKRLTSRTSDDNIILRVCYTRRIEETKYRIVDYE